MLWNWNISKVILMKSSDFGLQKAWNTIRESLSIQNDDEKRKRSEETELLRKLLQRNKTSSQKSSKSLLMNSCKQKELWLIYCKSNWNSLFKKLMIDDLSQWETLRQFGEWQKPNYESRLLSQRMRTTHSFIEIDR